MMKNNKSLTEDRTVSITRRVFAWTLFGSVVWISSLIFAPILKSRIPFLSGLIYAAFSPTCHQLSDRCFHLGAEPLAVCARCFGVYIGFLAGTLLFPFVKKRFPRPLPSALVFICFTFPVGLDTTANFFHVWNSPSWVRFLLGISWGTILPCFFIVGISEFFLSQRRE